MSGWTVVHLKQLLMSSTTASQNDSVAAYIAEGLGEQ